MVFGNIAFHHNIVERMDLTTSTERAKSMGHTRKSDGWLSAHALHSGHFLRNGLNPEATTTLRVYRGFLGPRSAQKLGLLYKQQQRAYAIPSLSTQIMFSKQSKQSTLQTLWRAVRFYYLECANITTERFGQHSRFSPSTKQKRR